MAIVLESNNMNAWKPGTVKAVFEKSAIKNYYDVSWLLGSKTEWKQMTAMQEKDSYLRLYNPSTSIIRSDENYVLLKLYPLLEQELIASPESKKLGSGTGFFITSSGYIATNAHVVAKAKNLIIRLMHDGAETQYKARIHLIDNKNDVAIIKIDDPSFNKVKDIPYNITEKTEIGEEVFTIGFPLNEIMGSNYKVTNGIISANSGIQDDVRYLQTTTPIQPGNSGGPLFNKQGKIVGLTTAKLNTEPIGIKSENVSYSIKSNYLQSLISMLPEDEMAAAPTSNTVVKEVKDQVKLFKDFVCIIESLK